jgi:elongation factor 1-alpha
MSLPKINLVVVGHKDHGKSTLIGRLLYDSKALAVQKIREIKEELKSGGKEFEFAFILDSLEEERIGGLTIDIMHTPFKSKKHFYTIIDCPGHKEFIQKMLTGASQANAAILVVSIKEGVEDQTKQHLYLIKTLGIKQLVVAVNKLDAIDYDKNVFSSFLVELKDTLLSLGYSDFSIVPISAYKGDNILEKSTNMKWYKGKNLIQTLDDTVKPPNSLLEKPLRCIVQDIYALEGGDVAICKVETGKLVIGNPVAVLPICKKGVVEKIESFGSVVKEGVPGDSIGVHISGITGLRRGYVLANIKTLKNKELCIVKEFSAQLIVFEDLKLTVGKKVIIRVGTAEIKCKVQEIIEKMDPVNLTVENKVKSIGEGQIGKILFKSLEPLYLDIYSILPQLGRFVILGGKGPVAAGIVLEKN